MDIVEKLQRLSGYMAAAGEDEGYPICDEAADEIERLREALKKIASYPHGGVTVKGECSGDRSDMILTARAALKGKS